MLVKAVVLVRLDLSIEVFLEDGLEAVFLVTNELRVLSRVHVVRIVSVLLSEDCRDANPHTRVVVLIINRRVHLQFLASIAIVVLHQDLPCHHLFHLLLCLLEHLVRLVRDRSLSHYRAVPAKAIASQVLVIAHIATSATRSLCFTNERRHTSDSCIVG